jgi:hypothetical protein
VLDWPETAFAVTECTHTEFDCMVIPYTLIFCQAGIQKFQLTTGLAEFTEMQGQCPNRLRKIVAGGRITIMINRGACRNYDGTTQMRFPVHKSQ